MKELLTAFDRQFRELDGNSRCLLSKLDDSILYARPPGLSDSMMPFSCGEFIVRSAAVVERTFGGITTRLWDDPFEWTLPEKLSTIDLIGIYLDVVEDTRKRGFEFFTSDDDLKRQIPAPKVLRPLASILLDAIASAERFQGKAAAIFHLTSEKSAAP